MMNFLKETEDKRGKIMWLVAGDSEIHVVEIKKGFSRGGHYHPFESVHLLVSGLVVYKQHNMQNGQDISKVVKPVTTIYTPSNHAHMISAIEDSVFIEVFEQAYKATDFGPYRKIVIDSMNRI